MNSFSFGTRPAAGRLAAFALAALLAVGLTWGMATAAAASPSASPGAEKVVLRIGTMQDVDSFNPFAIVSMAGYEYLHLNYDLLVGFAPNGDPRPEVADSWTMSPDGLTWTYKIHPGIKWHDGQPLTARDVAFTFNYIIDNQLAQYYSSVINIDSVEAVDDSTAVFHLAKPKANMLRLWVPILPEHIWGSVSPKKAEVQQVRPPVVGSGPFQVTEAKKGSYIIFTANKDYWRGAPTIDEVILQIYQNQDTMTMDLKSGSIDAAFDIPTAQFNALKSDPNLTTKAADYRYMVELAMNTYQSPNSLGNPVLKDPLFRQAISWAVDKQKIVDVAVGGYATVGQSLLDPLTMGYWTPPAEETFGYDPEKAKQLLDDAGYKDADGDGVREDKQGKPIKLRLVTRSEYPAGQRAGEFIAGWFEAIGLDIVLSVGNDGTINDALYNYKGDTYAPDYDMFVWGWGGLIDPSYMLGNMLTSQIEWWNDCCWSNAEFDKLYYEQDSQTDWIKRKPMVEQMQKLFYDSAPYIVLYYPKQLIAYNTAKWEGWVPYPSENGMVALQNDNVDSYLQLRLKPATATTTSSGSSNTAIIVGVIVAAVVVVLVVWLLLRRRGGRSEVAE